MARHLLGRIQVFGDQRRRHHQRLTHVHEPLTRGRIHREFAGWIERLHTRQIADRVGVLRICQTPQHHRSGIPGIFPGPAIEQPTHSGHQLLPRLGVHGRLILRRHFTDGNLFQHLLPNLGIGRLRTWLKHLLQIEFALVLRCGMAIETVTLEEHPRLGIDPFGGHGPSQRRRCQCGRRDPTHGMTQFARRVGHQ